MVQIIGLPTFTQRINDPEIKPALSGIFPTDNPKNTRFAINYFTSIGLGSLT